MPVRNCLRHNNFRLEKNWYHFRSSGFSDRNHDWLENNGGNFRYSRFFDWHNHDRLHGYLGDVPTAELEERFYATKRTDQTLVGIQ